jgi:hypothetical protein
MFAKALPLTIAFSLVVFATTTSLAQSELTEHEMAARVDALLAAAWKENGVTPAPPAADAEFLRRAWLDLCGIIPPINDNDGKTGIHSFLRDPSPDKRERLIKSLLKKPTHATHFANVWTNVMISPDANVRQFGRGNGFNTWVRGQFADNVPYNKMVSDLILAQGNSNQTGPALFYTALQLKPEELAASTSRIFLGNQIQCAQCHNHPFEHWTRKDFWGYAAFFAQLQRPAQPQQQAFQVVDVATGDVKIPDTDDVVPARFLGGDISKDVDGETRRVRLAKWLTAAENPWFARATVNRVWAMLFGRGIVDPVDDLGEHNDPSHPELLNTLSQYFVATGFDLNRLIRTLAITKAYQLSSQSTSDGEHLPELFSRMAIKTMSAEQLYDCLAEAMRRREGAPNAQQGFNRNFNQGRQAFLTKFRAPTQGATEYEAGIPQALTLMNGTDIRQATDLAQSDLLIALDAPFFSNEKRVEVLFLSTLSRMPDDDERLHFVEYVKTGGPTKDSRKALSDVLWALLNSAEFVLNH